jgi:hypothetical protein
MSLGYRSVVLPELFAAEPFVAAGCSGGERTSAGPAHTSPEAKISPLRTPAAIPAVRDSRTPHPASTGRAELWEQHRCGWRLSVWQPVREESGL